MCKSTNVAFHFVFLSNILPLYVFMSSIMLNLSLIQYSSEDKQSTRLP
jgi:hypothetical protein